MKKILLLIFVAVLIAGCKSADKTDDSALMDGQPFNLEQIDDQILGEMDDGTSFPGDLPAAGGTGMRFVEPGSGLLDPEIEREAQLVLQDLHFPYNSSIILPEEA
ncbi:MAG: hypothetical protein KAS17_07825, partial [Victivallaceae bacterium]|nr:hypothetical protein [Victivallaceae bacterium]